MPLQSTFKGFSYGFRPRRSQHNALDALTVGIGKREVNWVLDADIRGFFDTIDHVWLIKFIEHRIADQRTAGFPCRVSIILIPNSACALLPEAGAQCGRSARWDLCGGCRATGIPTAIRCPGSKSEAD